MPTASIIIPTHNRCEFLKRAIASALSQTLPDFEIVVVNDGSTDGTSDYLAALQEPRLRYVNLVDNRGGSSARNEGVKEATGEFVAFLDDDDSWAPVKLERQLEALCRNDADLCHTGLNCYTSAGKFIKYVFMRPRFPDIYKSIMNDNYLAGTSSIVVKKEQVEKAGGFDAELPALQDWDLYIRLVRNGCRVYGINEPLVNYCLMDESRNISCNFSRYKTATLCFQRKYRDAPFYPLLARRLKIIEFKRYVKSRNFLWGAIQYYSRRHSGF